MPTTERDSDTRRGGRRITRVLLAAAPLAALPLFHAAAAPSAPAVLAQSVDFNRDIRPILAANCFSCHGQDAAARQANLRLDTREGATAMRGGFRAIEPGKPESSSLITRINAANALMMPPAASGHHLNGEQKKLLTLWVKRGAPYAVHWAFAPISRPPVPRLQHPQWSTPNPIDAFVRARLERAGVAPSPEADPAALLRRVSLDLTGLPPTTEELNLFLQESLADRQRAARTARLPGNKVSEYRSDGPYERAVDRLLASPRFGEHWARMWLDLARYADTQGYEKDLPRTIWRYRDWVIDAFNSDMPYDRFTLEQLAGDLLIQESTPPAERQRLLLATAFHRNTMTNTEGGTDPEEFRVAAVKDRVDTTAQVWMGLTMGCAKCHTHKYDPISQREYYSFYALFNQTEDANRGNEAPTVPTPSTEQTRQLAVLDEQLTGLRAAFRQPVPDQAARQQAWEAELAAKSLWTPLRIHNFTAASGAVVKTREDGALLVSGVRPEQDSYALTLELPNSPVKSLRLEILKDTSLPNGGPGREASDQNVVVSEVTARLIRPDGEMVPLALRNPRADFEQGGWPISAAIDGAQDRGWAFSPQNAQPHVAVFDFAQDVSAGSGRLQVVLDQKYPKLQLGCFRLSVSGAEPTLLKAELQPFAEVAAIPKDRRTAEQQGRLDESFRQTHEPTAAIYQELLKTEKAREAAQKAIPNTPILRDLTGDKLRVTRIHQRGNFLDPGETVNPAVPASFGALPADAPLNRLGAARWLVSRDNPLTARVAVNRLWARLFGVGLVETEEDFGTQGSLPTHPELLDWLAGTFAAVPDTGAPQRIGNSGAGAFACGWSQKKLLKLIVTSATYRQSGVAEAGRVKADPTNRLLSRGPRFRLPAETIRDQALAVSGLLSAKTHGPSVMPPQPDGLWKSVYNGGKWETSPGEDRYRRSLYTFWKRSTPYPSLTTFDAGSGEFCVIRRIRTNTPLQALVTLNDPVFVEAAGALGKTMTALKAPTPREKLREGFRRVLARAPAEAELARLLRLYEASLADFRTRPDAATALLNSANTPVDASGDPSPQAAYTVVANVLLNLDETVTKP